MLLDSLRVLLSDPRLAAGDHRNTIEWHWYGAEEAGLLGSQDIFTQYRGLNIAVKAMLNQDVSILLSYFPLQRLSSISGLWVERGGGLCCFH
jgi:Zn-dependent M28 family amino/carboxypeptidase